MLSKQCDNIVGLEDYYRSLENKHLLRLTPTQNINLSFMSKDIDKIEYKNFKYNHFVHIPSDENIFSLLFNYIVIGERETKDIVRNRKGFNKDFKSISTFKNLYYIDEPYKRNNIKISYLKSISRRSYIIRKNEFILDNTIEKLFKNHLFKKEDIQELEDEFWHIIKSYAKDYNTLEIPKSFILEKKKKRGRVIIDGEISANIVTEYNSATIVKIKVADLIKFNGTIFYGVKEDDDQLRRAVRIMETIVNIPTINNYKKDIGFIPTKSSKANNNGKHSLMFIYLAKNNLKYINSCKKPIHIKHFDAKFLYRYMDRISNTYAFVNLHTTVNNFQDFIISKQFKDTFQNVADDINLCLKIKSTYENINAYHLTSYFDEKIFTDNKFYKDSIDSINKVSEINKYFNNFYNYMKVPYAYESNKRFFEFVKLVAADCDLLK